MNMFESTVKSKPSGCVEAFLRETNEHQEGAL